VRSVGYKRKDDPFGDETNSEVKYRKMEWWCLPIYLNVRRPARLFIVQASRHECALSPIHRTH